MDVTAILMLRLVHRCLEGQREASGGAFREVHWGLDQVGKFSEVMLELC